MFDYPKITQTGIHVSWFYLVIIAFFLALLQYIVIRILFRNLKKYIVMSVVALVSLYSVPKIAATVYAKTIPANRPGWVPNWAGGIIAEFGGTSFDVFAVTVVGIVALVTMFVNDKAVPHDTLRGRIFELEFFYDELVDNFIVMSRTPLLLRGTLRKTYIHNFNLENYRKTWPHIFFMAIPTNWFGPGYLGSIRDYDIRISDLIIQYLAKNGNLYGTLHFRLVAATSRLQKGDLLKKNIIRFS